MMATTTAEPTGRREVPAGLLLRWPAVTSLVVLVINDHLLKPTLATWWTGKLSGVAAFVLVPLVAVALTEVAGNRVLPRRTSVRIAAVVGVTIALCMAAVELATWASHVYEVVFGVLRWPLDALVAVGRGSPPPPLTTVSQTMDATDLLLLPAALAPALWLRHRA